MMNETPSSSRGKTHPGAGRMVQAKDGTVYMIGKDGSLRRTDFGKRPGKAKVKKEKRDRRK